MSRKDVPGRHLDLGVALAATLAAMPRLWLGACGILAALMALALACGLWPVGGPVVGLLVAMVVAAIVVAVGALARLSVAGDVSEARAGGLGPLGIQFGWPELRLVGAALLCLLFLAMILTILTLVVLAIFGTADLDVAAIQARDWANVGAPWKLAMLAIVGAGALLVPLLLIVRLSLFVPATIGRRQMVSLNSMGIAYGSFWPLLAGLIVTALPKIVLLTLLGTGVLEGFVAWVIGVVTVVGLQVPLTVGFLGAAYRQLEYWTPEEPRR